MSKVQPSAHGDRAVERGIAWTPLGRNRPEAAPAPKRPVERKAKPLRPILGLRSPLLEARPARRRPAPSVGFNSAVAVVDELTPGVPLEIPVKLDTIPGPEEILRALARKGIGLELSPDRQYIIPRAPGGEVMHTEAQLLRDATPLLLGHLRGEPLVCVVTKHSTPEIAVTVLVTGAPSCAACAKGS